MDIDFTTRQLDSIEAQVKLYEAGDIDLPWLISSLESLFDILDSIPEPTRKKLRKKWGVLEEVYSVSLHRQMPIDSIDNKRVIKKSLSDIRDLVQGIRSQM